MNDIFSRSIKDTPASLLIVDDEPLIRKILLKYLSGKRYIIETAENGSKALQKLDQTSFDLVLTDLRMPDMGGRELLRIMAERYPLIPKIVLTGYGTNEDIILALKTGAYDFLTKPITDFTILEHSIERAIASKRLNDERNGYIEQLKQINEIISMLNQGKSTEEVFMTLNRILKTIIPFNRLALATINKDNLFITTKLVVSDRDTSHREGDTLSIEDRSFQKVMSERTFLNIEKIDQYLELNPDSPVLKLLLEDAMESTLILPLIMNNRIRGFLIFSSVDNAAYKPEHIDFLSLIVGQIALSIQRGELLFEIEQHSRNLENLVELRTREIIKTQKSTVFALSKLAETRDPETGDHLERMRNYSVLLAQLLKYLGHHGEITSQFLRDIYDSSILHDIGKVGIPDGILLKDGYLSDYEFEIMKKHTIIGYDALMSASKDLGDDSYLKMGMDITLFHHERWDGKGYPKGLKGEGIPLCARIVAIADVYDALTSRRPYKEPFSHNKSLEIMKREDTRFDPALFSIFINNSDEFNKIRKEISGE